MRNIFGYQDIDVKYKK